MKPAEPKPISHTCGDSGGRTEAGEPCKVRVTNGGRCHHHQPEEDPADKELTPLEQLFVQEYLRDLNPRKAAIRAGYAPTTAKVHAPGWVNASNENKPHVSRAIKRAIRSRERRTQILADRVLAELVRVGLSDLTDYIKWDQDSVKFIPSDQIAQADRASLKTVKSKRIWLTREDGTQEERLEMELSLHDKLAALREAGKHLGITSKLELSGSVDLNLRQLSDEQLIRRAQENHNRLQALGIPLDPSKALTPADSDSS